MHCSSTTMTGDIKVHLASAQSNTDTRRKSRLAIAGKDPWRSMSSQTDRYAVRISSLEQLVSSSERYVDTRIHVGFDA